MKKITLVIFLGLCSMVSMAQSKSGISEKDILGRVMSTVAAQSQQIQADAKDKRILYFLGDTYKMKMSNHSGSTYSGPEGRGITISKKDGLITGPLYDSIEFLKGRGFSVKSKDGRNPTDQLVTMSRQKENGVDYKVLRFFVYDNHIIQLVVSRFIPDQDPLPTMRRMVQGVRSTPQKVLADKFFTEYCEFGDDCY